MAFEKLERVKRKTKNQFEPGNKASVGAHKARPMEMNEVRAVNREIMEGELCSMLSSPYARVLAIHANPEEITFRRVAASVIVGAVENQCASRFNFLLDRAIGKVREKEEEDASAKAARALERIPLASLITAGSMIIQTQRDSMKNARDRDNQQETIDV